MEVNEKIKEILIKKLAVDAQELTLDAHLQDDLGADSLLLLTIAGAISQHFKIALVVDDLVNLDSVEELVELVQTKVEKI
jgi:acyl carrier protein